MTLTKNKMVREVGRRTRLKNRDVQAMLEALVEVWIEELVEGSGRIELENFVILETKRIDRGQRTGQLDRDRIAPRHIVRVSLRLAKHLRKKLSSIHSPSGENT